MMDPPSMSDSEIRDHLKFTPGWFELGIVDDALLECIIRQFRASDDASDEHWRYGAFMHFLKRQQSLTAQQCQALFQLGAEDPDWEMGLSIIIQVLERPECPDSLWHAAKMHPRTAKWASRFLARSGRPE